MHSKWRLYLSSLVAVASLLDSAVVLGSKWQRFGAEAGGLIVLVATWMVLMAGAPLYALLAGTGYVRWWSVLLVAVLPSLLVAWSEPTVAATVMLIVPLTAVMTHLLHHHTRLGRWGLGATTATTAPPA